MARRRRIKTANGPTQRDSRKFQNPLEMERKFEMERRRRLKNKLGDPVEAQGMLRGGAPRGGKRGSGKIAKKIEEIGNMKVKDAVSAVSKGVSALTPAGIALTISSKLKGKKKDPMKSESQASSNRLRRRPPKRPTPEDLQKNMKPSEAQLLLTGGQAKLDKNKNNKIDAQDFKILRAEKAKGKGKVTKAALGVLAAGISAKKRMDKKKMAPVGMGAIGAGTAKLDAMKRILGLDKGGMGEAKGYKKYLKGLKKAEGEQFRAKFKAKQIARAGGKAAARAAKASRIGKIALGVAAVGLGAKEFLKRKMEKNKNQPQKKMGGGLTEATRRLKAQGKMGGGMMKKPMGYNKGEMIRNPARPKNESELQKKVDRDATIRKARESIDKIKFKEKDRLTSRDMELLRQQAQRRRVNQLRDKRLNEALEMFTVRAKALGKMGGGMMMRPNPVGMKSGKSVKVKCKLGRNKPTKMY